MSKSRQRRGATKSSSCNSEDISKNMEDSVQQPDGESNPTNICDDTPPLENQHVNNVGDLAQPVDTSPAGMLTLLLSIKADTTAIVNSLGKRVDSVEERLDVIEHKQSAVTGINDDVNSIQNNVSKLKETVSVLVSKNDILMSKLLISDRRQKSMENELSQLKAHSMKKNLIFNIDPKSFDLAKEVKGENCMSIIRQFLMQKMGISEAQRLYITACHRVGKFVKGHSRPILVQFPAADARDKILGNASMLKGTHHYLTTQMPPEYKERNQFAFPSFKEAKGKPDVRARLTNGHLYLDGVEQTQYQPPRLPVVDTCQMGVKDFPVGQSDVIEEGASDFTGFAAEISSLHDVAFVKDQLIRTVPQVPAADHIMIAYRFTSKNNVLHQNFDSDRDHGVGLEMLKYMQNSEIMNYVFVATRHCSPQYKHIGKKRFELANELCTQAMNRI